MTESVIHTAYHYLFFGALIWFGILLFIMLVRAIIGPRITDRILAINVIGTMVICAIAILSRALGESYLVDVALLYAMISFIAVLILARTYIPTGKTRAKYGREVADEVQKERGYLEKLEEKEEEVIYDEDINVDDFVSIPSMNIYGKVTRVKGNKAHIVSDSGLSFDVSREKLHKVAKPKVGNTKVRTTNYDLTINTKVGIELNLIGMRVEEAKNTLIKYIDNCRLKHLSQVRIIHGFGSGALRTMVRSYLDTQKGLSYRAGGEHEGGGGCTVVIFK